MIGLFRNEMLNKISVGKMKRILNESGHSLQVVADKLEVSRPTVIKLVNKLGFTKKWKVD